MNEDTTYRLLIVEDDLTIAKAIKEKADSWGLESRYVSDFKNVKEEFETFKPHIVLLDIKLPFFDGYYWCREIRKISKIPIVFISSASDNMNIIMAINMGADDFIAKPFDLEVLNAKLQALLRRSYDFTYFSPSLEFRGAILDVDNQSLNYEDHEVELTNNEFKILKILLEEKKKVVSREKLMEKLWKSEAFINENTLTVNINRLRKKLDSVGLNNFITTIRGAGYIIE